MVQVIINHFAYINTINISNNNNYKHYSKLKTDSGFQARPSLSLQAWPGSQPLSLSTKLGFMLLFIESFSTDPQAGDAGVSE